MKKLLNTTNKKNLKRVKIMLAFLVSVHYYISTITKANGLQRQEEKRDMEKKWTKAQTGIRGELTLLSDYMCSVTGDIMKVTSGRKFPAGHILKGTVHPNGHRQYRLKVPGLKYSKSFRGHRVIYESFNGLIPKDREIHHGKRGKLCNDLRNLELVSFIQHKLYDLDKYLKANRLQKLVYEDAVEIRRKREAGVLIKDLANEYCISGTHLFAILRGSAWKKR